MNKKFSSSTIAHILRVILAGVLTFVFTMSNSGQILQAAAESLARVEGRLLASDVTEVNNFSGKLFELALKDGKLQYNDTVDTRLATRQDLDPDINPEDKGSDDCNSNQGERTVWYRYFAETDINLYVDTIGSSEKYDTVLAVWTYSSGNFTLVACNDDYENVAGSSRLGFFAKSGTTYYIEILEYTSPYGSLRSEVEPSVGGGDLVFHVEEGNFSTTDVHIGDALVGDYTVPVGEERREYYDESGGPVVVESTNGMNIVSAIRLQSYAPGILYSFVETMGVPAGSLSSKYYFPTYNNTWGPLNSQLRFGNLNDTDIKVKVTIGTSSWTYDVPANSERREYLAVSGGPVIIESVDSVGNPIPDKKIIAAIRLQSYASGKLYSFAETMGLPYEKLSNVYYFPTYNNTWGPLNSQLRFGNLNNTSIKVKVTIGTDSWTYDVPANSERREYLDVSGGPVIVESVDTNGASTPDKKIIAAIRLQSYASGILYSFVETMGVPDGSLSSKYYLPTYNNTWGPLNSQLRFGNLNNTAIKVKVTIGTSSWTYDVPANSERREYLAVSDGPVIIESVNSVGDPTPDKQIVAAIRLQSYASGKLYSFSETMGIPVEQLSKINYFPTYNNTWGPLNSQLRFGVP